MFPATCVLFLDHDSINRWLAVFLLAWGFLQMGDIALAHHDKGYKPSPGDGGKGPAIDTLAPVFTLTDQQGRALSLADMRGKVVLITFIYTTCVDACPLLTAAFAALQRELKGQGQKEVFFLSITTDPEIDTPEVLQSYAKRYKADFSSWAFLSGKVDTLKQVWRDYGIRVKKRDRGLVDHTLLTLLVDQSRVVRHKYFGSAIDVGTLLSDIMKLTGGKNQ